METKTVCSTVTRREMEELRAELAAALPDDPPPAPRATIPPGGTLCAFATDTGEPAFVGLPCRGHRIECRKTGVVTYAANCRDGICKFYREEDQQHEEFLLQHR